ncbi:MAG TPA: 50S ribosomal protein L24 [Myxococcota bacterium]|nr:50S ribosomal protein L24 [Myxococcota bacterium]
MSKNKMRIRRGDTVVVLSGDDSGTVGRVLRVEPDERRLAVEGVGLVKRHVPRNGDQAGGIVTKERLIDASNVALWNAAEGRRVKIGYRTLEDGQKVRVDRKSGAVLDKA